MKTLKYSMLIMISMHSMYAQSNKTLHNTEQALAALSADKIVHPKLSTLEELLASKETRQIAENIVKSDFDEKTWFIIKSLKPGQFTQATGQSGKSYMFKVNHDGSLNIIITRKK
jgi:hypothetical protein